MERHEARLVLSNHEEKLIVHIPCIRRLRLQNVGPWRETALEFAEGINIITGHSGSGKSILLQALAFPLNPWLNPRHGAATGVIEIEYARRAVSYLVAPPAGGDPHLGQDLSPGQKAFWLLENSLARTPIEACLLIEDEVLSALDPEHYAQAAYMINEARCQFIIALNRIPKPSPFRNPRIFECRYDQLSGESSLSEL